MKLDFIDQLIKDKYPLAYGFEFDPENVPDKGRFIAKDGIYTMEKTKHFDMFYRESSGSFGFGGELKPFLKPRSDMPRVPIKIMATIFAFYREVYAKSKTEVQVNVYWNHNNLEIPDTPGLMSWGNDLYTYVPKQVVSSVRTTYESSKDPLYMWLVDNLMVVVDTHSHHSMEAFMSGTDSSNSDRPAVYLDLGHIMQDIAHLHAWAARDNQHILEDLDASELYKFIEELPHVDEYVTQPTYKSTSYSNKRYDSATKKWVERTPVKPKVETEPVKKLFKGTTEQFDSKELLKHAIDVPKEWHDQITYNTYSFGKQSYGKGVTSGVSKSNFGNVPNTPYYDLGHGDLFEEWDALGYSGYFDSDYGYTQPLNDPTLLANTGFTNEFGYTKTETEMINWEFEQLLNEGALTIVSVHDVNSDTAMVIDINFEHKGNYKKQFEEQVKLKVNLTDKDLQSTQFSFMCLPLDESMLITLLNEHPMISDVTESELEIVAKQQFMVEKCEENDKINEAFDLTTSQLDTIYELTGVESISANDGTSMMDVINKIYAGQLMLVDTLDPESVKIAEELGLHATNHKTTDYLEIYVK